MSFLIDTHAHLYAEQFDNDRTEMIHRAFDSGVRYMFLPNIDLESIDEMHKLESAFPENCFAMMGLHPCSVDQNYKSVLKSVRNWLEKRDYCAVGEIGLDYYWSKEFIREQKEAFRIQCSWAKEFNLPIIIHARESLDDLIQIVSEENTNEFKGIFHCFGGTLEQAEKIISMGFLIGLGGVLTFKKANLAPVIEKIDIKHIVLETDAPYLSPVPYRGKRNESAYIQYVAEKLSEIKQLSMDEICSITSENALKLFNKLP